MKVPVALALLLILLPSLAPAQVITLQNLAQGLDSPVGISHAGDGDHRLFILERAGRVRVYDGALRETPFLDISARVGCCGERGLLGMAFDPDFASTGVFYLNYTNRDFDTVIARYRADPGLDRAAADSEEILLTVPQPFANHNGGQLAFGPDGYLYVGLGDGGGGGDPQNRAQNLQSLLGKVLRLDVSGGGSYAIPADNPFTGQAPARAEIWASGLRNPFRFSFDRVTGELYIADVGQDRLEEVNRQPASAAGGANYGWRLMEGGDCFNPVTGCNDGSLTLPAFDYAHDKGRCSITGGYLYRGRDVDALAGRYVYGDFCSGEIFAATEEEDGWRQEVLLASGLSLTSFGADARGELYTVGLGGGLYRLASALAISPASGSYLGSQVMDVALIVPGGRGVTSIRAWLNGTEISANLRRCLIPGTLEEGGESFRCPAIPFGSVRPGTHLFRVEVTFGDGGSAADSVQWEIMPTSE